MEASGLRLTPSHVRRQVPQQLAVCNGTMACQWWEIEIEDHLVPLQSAFMTMTTTSTPEDKDNELIQNAEAVPEQYRLEWVPEATKSPTKSLRRRRHKRGHEHDPSHDRLQGECLYASIHFLLSGEMASRSDTRRLRNYCVHFLYQHVQHWDLLSTVEGMDKLDYIRLLRAGWGGAPEIYMLAKIYNLAIQVQLTDGSVLLQAGKAAAPHILLYNGQHYWVKQRSPLRSMRAPSSRWCRGARGGMPKVSLADNKGRLCLPGKRQIKVTDKKCPFQNGTSTAVHE